MVLPPASPWSALDTHGQPKPRNGRKLILCFDGTANLFTDANTNVVKLVSFLKKNDYRHQMVYYQAGVGTYVNSGVAATLMSGFAQMAAYGIAWDINYHIMGGYTFLMQNWVPGDAIYLFGFSRGAYTARALAGMLHKVGLLPRGNDEQVPFAYAMYLRTDEKGWEESTGFKEAFCTSVYIDFVGVWDTVESVGMLKYTIFPFTGTDNHIRIFRHALSLDERRVKFKANHWHAGLTMAGAAKEAEDMDGRAGLTDTDVQEVWFAGGHGDVGGGNVLDNSPYDPARIPLIWMLRELVLTGTDIEFDEAALKKADIELPLTPTGMSPYEKHVPEQRHILPEHHIRNVDKRYGGDLRAGTTDQLVAAPIWWLLELLPVPHLHHGPNGKIQQVLRANLGSPRGMPTLPPRAQVHISVKERMQIEGTYRPAAKWQDEPNWVE